MNAFERWLLWSATLLAGGSGVVYAWMKYLLRPEDPYAVVHHPLQPWILKVHLFAAPSLVFAVGVIFSRHVLGLWRSGKPDAKRSGLATFFLFAGMVGSGILVQSATSQSSARWFGWTHAALGAAFLLSVGIHQATGALLARRHRAAAAEAPLGEPRATGAAPDPVALPLHPARAQDREACLKPRKGGLETSQSSAYRRTKTAPRA